MYRYHPGSSGWITTNTPATYGGAPFYFNGKIFYGFDFSLPNSWPMYVCDLTNKMKWTNTGLFLPFTATENGSFATYFTLNNRGYVITIDNHVWQFNPVDTIWTRKNDFPGQSRNMAVSVVLNGFVYFGTGASGTSSLSDIWKYDPADDSWVKITDIPVARFGAVAFSIGNKIYLGFGMFNNSTTYYQYIDLKDFYEFDPNFPSK
jgi:hypothetical protein